MDRRFLIALIWVFSSSVSFAASSNNRLPLDSKWIAENVNKAYALSWMPVECLNPSAGKMADLGRLLFESPALLGGQAARMGLSCSSCHPSGRTNPNFFIRGVSSTKGTADVKESFFSSNGGDQHFHAVTIPDLADRNQTKIVNRNSREFRDKIRELVQVEFDGQAASIKVIDALQNYLANTDLSFCVDPQMKKDIDLMQDWQRLLETIEFIEQAIVDGHEKHFVLLVRVARQLLGKIYHRYGILDDESIDQNIIESSRKIESLASADLKNRTLLLEQWYEHATILFLRLKETESKSGYSEDDLEHYLDK